MPDSERENWTLYHAHKRLDEHDKMFSDTADRLETIGQWQNRKDDAIKTIKNWVIGGVIVYTIQTVGIFELLRKAVL